MSDLTLFEPGVRNTDPATSRAASASMKPVLRKEQHRVLLALHEIGDATAYEVMRRLGDQGIVRQQNCVAKRCSELAAKLMVRDTCVTRPGSSNRPLTVWTVTDTGRAALENVSEGL